jgi:TetR/AcrR family transcriptional repressor of mexJK operon
MEQLSEERTADSGRSAQKRRAIIDAATALFLAQGYEGTSMDEVAASAAVSKQTVYKHFDEKAKLFSAIILGVAAQAEAFVSELPQMLETGEDLDSALTAVAHRYIATVMDPQVLQLRRLVISEADRFPDLARTYYERMPGRTLATLAEQFNLLAQQRRLRIENAEIAAGHFAFMVLGLSLDRAMFLGSDSLPSEDELLAQADAAVTVFLAAYGA